MNQKKIQTNQNNTDHHNLQKNALNTKTDDVENKTRNVHYLATKTVFDTKVEEAANKILDASDLVKKTDYDDKVSKSKIYFTSPNYNEFESDILHTKILYFQSCKNN